MSLCKPRSLGHSASEPEPSLNTEQQPATGPRGSKLSCALSSTCIDACVIRDRQVHNHLSSLQGYPSSPSAATRRASRGSWLLASRMAGVPESLSALDHQIHNRAGRTQAICVHGREEEASQFVHCIRQHLSPVG